MKYFLDTEYIEGFHKPISWLPTIGNFNKSYHSIQLISIGLVASDGRVYYAVSNEFNPKDADDWVVNNVLLPIYTDFVHGDMRNHAHFSTKKNSCVTWGRGKSNKQIAKEIYNFINPDLGFHVTGYNNSELKGDTKISKLFDLHNVGSDGYIYYAQPEFYAYYADYDWVVFCSLFGRMIDIPKGFPMYCKDLKQSLDEAADNRISGRWVNRNNNESKIDFELRNIKAHPKYPKQENEHSALDDARWNKKLYEFIKSVKKS